MSFEDAAPTGRQPILNLPPVTKALLLLNILVHGGRFFLTPDQDEMVVGLFGFAPAAITSPDHYWWAAMLSPLTYQFLHADFAHIGMNMLGLAAFGSGVERRLGGRRFLLFYLLCGIAGAALQLAVSPMSEGVLIGASASISGLFGGVLRFGQFRQGFWTIVGVWLVMNAVIGFVGVPGEAAPIAWIAHVGGFALGLGLFPFFERFRRS